MYEYRITKYENLCDSDGRWIEDWTCPSEIGHDVGGRVLTSHEYLQTEAKYVAAAMDILRQSELPHLRGCRLESRGAEVQGKATIVCKEDDPTGDTLSPTTVWEDMIVPVAKVPHFIKLAFRPWYDVNFDLEIADRFYITFGYDMQMWVGSESEPSLDGIRATGLFVCADRPNTRAEDGPWRIAWYRPAPEDPHLLDDAGDCPVALNRDRIRKIFGLSEEHPAHHNRCILPCHADRLNQYVNLDWRFNEFSYELINESY